MARVLGQLADYAEKNGAQIADGIGRAVEAPRASANGSSSTARDPEVLRRFWGVSFFAGLAKDVGAVGALDAQPGLRRVAGVSHGFAALGAEAGGAFTGGGFSAKLKGLGGTLKAAFSSPGVLAPPPLPGPSGTDRRVPDERTGDAIEHGAPRCRSRQPSTNSTES